MPFRPARPPQARVGITRLALLGALALSPAFGVSPAFAAGCATPNDRATFQVVALQSEFQVMAEACHDEAQYNAFVNRYRPELTDAQHGLDAWFAHAVRSKAQAMHEHDAFITALANGQAEESLAQGTNYCDRNAPVFDEAMALEHGTQLAAFAAGKKLLPATAPACALLPADAPVSKSKVRRATTVHH